MIYYYEGTVFNVGAQALVNTVNTVGVMGAGIALEFALRYPNMLIQYKEACENKSIKLGKVYYYKSNGEYIINFPTKGHFKYPSKIQWIEQGLKDFTQTIKKYDIKSVAFPCLGCSNGGLLWSDVSALMVKYLSDLDIDIFICLNRLLDAEGKEKEMVDRFNNIAVSSIQDVVKINKNTLNKLESIKPIKRFWNISETKGIGRKTYAELFDYFYRYDTLNRQITLFDEEIIKK